MYITAKCRLVIIIMHALVSSYSSNAFGININVTSDHILNITATTSFISVEMTTSVDQQLLVASTVTSIDAILPTTKENVRNITGYVIENDDADTSLSELQTLFITCTFTLLCLVGVVIVGFILRICWRKLKKRRHSEVYDGVLNKDSSSAPLKGNLTLSADELKTAESQLSVAGTGDTEGVDLDAASSPVLTYSGASNRTNHASANGSIITMTLKNNHLIVETEERNDIMENSRETTMKYSPSSHDGVFVVEVQQGVRRTPNYPTTVASYNSPEEISRSSGVNHQRALVHYPPAKILTNTEEDVTTSTDTTNLVSVCAGATTGLSQSDLSESSNNFYRYGNQEGYNCGYYGYSNYKGYAIDTSCETQFQSSRNDEIMTITTNVCKNLTSNTNDNVNRRQSVFEPYLLSDVQEKERFSIQKETDRLNENANKSTNILTESLQHQIKPQTTDTTDTTNTTQPNATQYTDLTNNIVNNYTDDMKNARQVVSCVVPPSSTTTTTGCSLNEEKLLIEGYHSEQIDTIKS